MNKKRRIPKNPDCPLTKVERVKLCKLLDEIEWREYYPMKHLSGAFADATVYKYDEENIHVELKWGTEGQGGSAVYTDDIIIDREKMLL
jgi:hypothetical protein